MPPRAIRPKNEPLMHDSNDSAGEGKGARRKAVSSACIPCRKRKSKCDGQVPACSTCVAVYRTECSYDADSDHRRKGALKRDIQSLQQQNDALDVIVASLRSLPEADAIALLHNLRGEANAESIADSIRSNVRLPHSFAPQTLEADLASQIASPASSVYRPSPIREHSGDSQSFPPSSTSTPDHSTGWFRVPQDAEFIEHLLSLYNCWVQPFHAFVSWDHFVYDMGRGRDEFCSSMLINAILAFACHYSDRPMARTVPNDPGTAGAHYFAEAHRILDQTEKPSLTAVQALGIMSLRETSDGRDSNGYRLAGRCVRMALELGLHLSVLENGMRQQQIEVRKVVFWAVFNLETMCALGFGRLSQLPRSATDIEKPSANARSEKLTWRPYEDANVSVSPSAEQPARTMLFSDCLSKLSELASDMVNTFYAPHERFTSRRLGATYALYRAWYQNLPDAFRLENTSLPHVLVLHMYYYGCVLHLFRPYIKLDLTAVDLYPRDVCTFCANQISALMNALRAMYGLRRVCLAVTNLLLSASTIHLLNLPSEPAAAHLTQGLHDLEAMSVNHRFAARAVDIIRSLSSKWNISLPEGAAAVAVYRTAGLRGMAATPPSTFFAASISRDQSSGHRSEGSGKDDSPFGPPPVAELHNGGYEKSIPIRRHNPSIPMCYSDPTTDLDASQARTAFWTPFPAQVMPMAQYDMGTSDFDVQQQWQMFGGSNGLLQEMHGRQSSAPGRLDETMSGMDEWNWQGIGPAH